MKFLFLDVAPANEAWADQAAQLYQKKISHFVDFQIQSASSRKTERTDSAGKIQVETDSILKILKPDDFVVLFDEHGRTMDSIRFSGQMERLLGSGKKRAVWIVGGAFGVSEEIKSRAQLKVSLAPFVLNHLVARTVALEQIYRAFTILKRIPYHNA